MFCLIKIYEIILGKVTAVPEIFGNTVQKMETSYIGKRRCEDGKVTNKEKEREVKIMF
jgi:hypothetical protein